MKFTATVNGSQKIQTKLKNLEVLLSAEVREALTLSAFAVQAYAKKSIQKSPADSQTGRSKPGNPPKTDTGRLVNSIFVNIEETPRGLLATVGTNVEYGVHLEFGTKHVAARPWLAPALAAVKAEALRKISLAVAKARRRLMS